MGAGVFVFHHAKSFSGSGANFRIIIGEHVGDNSIKRIIFADFTHAGDATYPGYNRFWEEGVVASDDDYHIDIPVYITENGISLSDTIGLDGKVNDNAREVFLVGHIKEVVKAKKDGINLCGYFHWSLYDNLEWNSGFSKRFGVVYTDFKTYEKIPKQSFYRYAALIEQYRDI